MLAAAIIEEKGLQQNIVGKDYILPSKSISGYFIDENGIRLDSHMGNIYSEYGLPAISPGVRICALMC